MGQIACVKPTVTYDFSCRCFILIVTLHDDIAADDQLTDHSRCHVTTGII